MNYTNYLIYDDVINAKAIIVKKWGLEFPTAAIALTLATTVFCICCMFLPFAIAHDLALAVDVKTQRFKRTYRFARAVKIKRKDTFKGLKYKDIRSERLEDLMSECNYYNRNKFKTINTY